MIRVKHCPICDSDDLIHYKNVVDHSISKEEFNLERCTNCGFILTNPQPLANDLWKYYESEEYVSHSKTTKGFIHYWYRQFQNLNLQLKFNAIRPIVPRGTWLDYGAGGGDFVRFINRKNISIIGIEPSQTARLSAANDGIELHEMSYLNTIGDSSLACITMWHVLEHISDFRDVLNTLNSKLIEGGLLIIAVPNPHSLDAKHYDEKWAAYDVPRHLWHFSEMDIQSLSDQLNLEVIRIKGMPLDSTYVSLLSEKYSNGSKLSGIIQGLRSNLMALFKKRPYSSQIYILRK